MDSARSVDRMILTDEPMKLRAAISAIIAEMGRVLKYAFAEGKSAEEISKNDYVKLKADLFADVWERLHSAASSTDLEEMNQAFNNLRAELESIVTKLCEDALFNRNAIKPHKVDLLRAIINLYEALTLLKYHLAQIKDDPEAFLSRIVKLTRTIAAISHEREAFVGDHALDQYAALVNELADSLARAGYIETRVADHVPTNTARLQHTLASLPTLAMIQADKAELLAAVQVNDRDKLARSKHKVVSMLNKLAGIERELTCFFTQIKSAAAGEITAALELQHKEDTECFPDLYSQLADARNIDGALTAVRLMDLTQLTTAIVAQCKAQSVTRATLALVTSYAMGPWDEAAELLNRALEQLTTDLLRFAEKYPATSLTADLDDKIYKLKEQSTHQASHYADSAARLTNLNDRYAELIGAISATESELRKIATTTIETIELFLQSHKAKILASSFTASVISVGIAIASEMEPLVFTLFVLAGGSLGFSAGVGAGLTLDHFFPSLDGREPEGVVLLNDNDTIDYGASADLDLEAAGGGILRHAPSQTASATQASQPDQQVYRIGNLPNGMLTFNKPAPTPQREAVLAKLSEEASAEWRNSKVVAGH